MEGGFRKHKMYIIKRRFLFWAACFIFTGLSIAGADAYYENLTGKKFKTTGEVRGVMSEDGMISVMMEREDGECIVVYWDNSTYNSLKSVLSSGNRVSAVVKVVDGGSIIGVSAERLARIIDTKKTSTLLDKNRKLSSSDLQAINVYEKTIKYFNPKLTSAEVRKISSSILTYSKLHNVDPRLVVAVIAVESDFKIDARSVKGAVGLGQLMPQTAKSLKVNPHIIEENIRGTTSYLRFCMEQWKKYPYLTVPLALAAYNAGPAAVAKHGGIPPYYETQNYVIRVMDLYAKLCSK